MFDLKILLTMQAILVWSIVFSASAPIPRLGNRLASALVVLAIVLTVILYVSTPNGEGVLLTSTIAGYGWGCLAHTYTQNKLAARERKVLNGE